MTQNRSTRPSLPNRSDDASSPSAVDATTPTPERFGAGPVTSSGHHIEVNTSASTVRIRNAAGRVELTVRCTSDGCVLEFAAMDLALAARGKLTLDCDELSIEARRGIELNTRGDWASHIAGHSITRVGGRAETHADELELSAKQGDAIVRANDRVRVVGEQILLNSEFEGQSSRDQLEEFWRSLGL